MYMNSSRNVNRTQILVQILSELDWLNVSSQSNVGRLECSFNKACAA